MLSAADGIPRLAPADGQSTADTKDLARVGRVIDADATVARRFQRAPTKSRNFCGASDVSTFFKKSGVVTVLWASSPMMKPSASNGQTISVRSVADGRQVVEPRDR